METFAEQKGKKPFNWNAFLNKKTFTESELRKAEKLAENWVTCACGNMCSIIPRDGWRNQPLDTTLRNLGGRFSDKIDKMTCYHNGASRITDDFNQDYKFEKAKKEAIAILKEIEERSEILIKKEIEKMNKKLGYTLKKV